MSVRCAMGFHDWKPVIRRLPAGKDFVMSLGIGAVVLPRPAGWYEDSQTCRRCGKREVLLYKNLVKVSDYREPKKLTTQEYDYMRALQQSSAADRWRAQNSLSGGGFGIGCRCGCRSNGEAPNPWGWLT